MDRGSHLSRSSRAEGAKVLIVDSDARSVHELASALRDEGYAAFEATSFAEAKRLWVSESPHVLVADVCQGQFNGLQLLMQAREEKPDLTAVITCAFADVVLEAEARRFGGIFLVKPLEPRQILAAIGASSRNGPAAAQAAPSSHHAFANLRGEDRRRLVILNFSPDRRTGDRRANSDGMSTA